MIMAKYRCERCQAVLTREQGRNNVKSLEVEDGDYSWEIEVAIISEGWWCDECRNTVMRLSYEQALLDL
jgi:hypothetical protein